MIVPMLEAGTVKGLSMKLHSKKRFLVLALVTSALLLVHSGAFAQKDWEYETTKCQGTLNGSASEIELGVLNYKTNGSFYIDHIAALGAKYILEEHFTNKHTNQITAKTRTSVMNLSKIPPEGEHWSKFLIEISPRYFFGDEFIGTCE